MSKPKIDNKVKSNRPPGNPAWKKGGASPNPAGAPKRGESWRELISEMGNLDGPNAAARAGFLAKQFSKLPNGVTLKELVVLRVYAALIDEPQPGLLNCFIERVEGKVVDELKLSGGLSGATTVTVIWDDEHTDKPTEIAPGPATDTAGGPQV